MRATVVRLREAGRVALMCAGAATVAAGAMPVRAQERLDLENAVRLALTRNERAGSAAATREAAEARLDRARAFFFPDLTATGSYTRRAFETTRTVDGQPFTIQSRNALAGNLTATMPIFDPRSIPLYRQALHEARAARFTAADDVRLLAFEAADAFLATTGSQQILTAAERRTEYATAARQDARVRFDAGLAGANDVSRADLELASAQRALADARAVASTALLELGFLLDTPVAPPLESPEQLLTDSAAPLPSDSLLTDQARRRRPDLAAGREHVTATRLLAQEPLMRALPNFNFVATTRRTNERGLSGRATDWSLGVNAAWPLYDGGDRYAERAERRALSRVASLELRAGERRTATQVARARVALEQARAALDATTAAVGAAQRNATETMELYRQGLARALELADANVRLFEAEVGLAGERVAVGRAFLDLRAALGLDPLGREP